MCGARVAVVIAVSAVPFLLGVRSALSEQCYTPSVRAACGCVTAACQPCLNGSCPPGPAKACNVDYLIFASPDGKFAKPPTLEACWTGFTCGPVDEGQDCGPENPCTQKRAIVSEEMYWQPKFQDGCTAGGGGAQ